MASVVQAMLEPDSRAIKEHIDALFAPACEEYAAGLIELRYGYAAALDRHAYFNLRDEGRVEAAAFAAGRNREGCNVYVGVNPRKPSIDLKRAASDKDVEIAFWHFADLDDAGAIALAQQRLNALPPAMSVTTGTTPHRRAHLYWLLDAAIGNMPAWVDRQRGVAQALQGDSVINPSRIMRLAGTVNFPAPHKLQRGYRVELTALRTVYEDERPPVSPECIAAAYPWAGPSSVNSKNPAPTQTTLQAIRKTRVEDLLAACCSGHEWHNNMIRLVAHMASAGRTSAEILALAEHITLSGFTADQTRREMAGALASARSKWTIPEPVDDGAAEDVARANDSEDLVVVDAFDFVEVDIPVRPWLVPGAVLSGYTHILAAPGGTGKSLFTLQFAISLAAGIQWGAFTPRRRCRSLIINVEDDLDEQRRRLAAAARVMSVDPQTLRGWIYLVDSSQGVVVAAHDPIKRSLIMTPVAGKLRDFIKKHAIDVLWADPFAETFEGDENDNSEVKWAMKIWRDEVARATKSAVYLVHHTTKHAGNGAGDANVIRGAGAIVNSTRISATLMPMTADEATAIGVEQAERHLYVRYDDAKANQSLKSGTARWLRKETVVLNNGAGLQEPDEVGALVPWIPPDAFDGISLASISMVLDRVEEGMIDATGAVTGVRFTASAKGGSKDSGRWVGGLLMELLGMKEAQVKKVIGTWLATGVLVEQNYHCPERRRDRAGLFAPYDKRPGATS